MPITRDLIIDGKDVPAADGRTTDDVNPFTGKVFATVAASGPEDVTRAVDAADRALPAWSATPPSARRAIFLRAAELFESRVDEAVAITAAEVGGAAPWARFNAVLAANMLREAAAAITQPLGEVLATDTPGQLSYAVREPMGVVAAFAPWNAPLILGIRAVAVPMAVGNTAVLKPSEDAPIGGGLFLADIFRDAGLPAGVLNVITNDRADAAAVAQTLIADDRVRVVNFTGSTEVGRIIGATAAQHLKPAVLELGGKNSLLVLDDADIDYAVDAAAFGSFHNAGQVCMSTDRVLVHRSVVEEFTAKLAAKIESLPHGDPADPATVVGPLINARGAAHVAELVAEAVAAGARVRTGGRPADGTRYTATVLDKVTPQMRIYREEIFGPAVTVIAVDSDDEAVAVANDTPYGLSAGIITEDTRRGLALARRLRTGIVHVGNQTIDDEAQAPFGGVKSSGYGRFGGRWGIDAFTDVRWVTVADRHNHFPF
ncbi:aldehyde dehydrogenase family protein [Kutzneria kofuensis]|uniref:Acyl-CoA reductase-like NAD-dependent aldehyde dehydrogenase n=1 Tax=Kutzneria kofuensis TaxID=103725 RepID=A0A7W9KPJ9_9PSEU|nr:aldehyde dehydrogenase family protein [Kutzneria kofuensis]MBB5896385.1 acyl-CoA reductase-like NAD-dependent aldehyde dehydrogenase [Kutzneria kofuensis]